MKIGFAQINPTVGDLSGNYEKILGAYERLTDAGAELVLTPELAITGYPPQDLVFKSQFVPQNLEVLDKLQARLRSAALLVGYVERNQGRGKPFHNAAALLQPGAPISKTFKSLLPTYDVFDEDRYFEPGCNPTPLMLGAKIRNHDLRGYLDGTLPAAAILRRRASPRAGGAGGGNYSEPERLAFQPEQTGDPARDGLRARPGA